MAGINKRHLLLMLPGILWLTSCASTDKLFAEYDENFCPATDPLVETKTIEKEVFRDRVVIKEIDAGGNMMPWEPAIYFDTGSALISKAGKRALSSNRDLLIKFPMLKASIRGFTDQHADSDYNRKLSMERITSVRSYFIRRGIAAERMIGYAHGESMAMKENISVVHDDVSRRVEMILIDENGRPMVQHQPVVLGSAE